MATQNLADACCAYADLRSSSQLPLARIKAILARYSEVWQSASVFQGDDSQIPKGAVESSTTALQRGRQILLRYDAPFQEDANGPWTAVRRVAALPVFARLNYHKQLSTTNIGLNIDATHNRLAHMLGTMDVAGCMLQHLCNTIQQDAYLPTPTEATAVLFFAFIHDAFHGPLGHSLDRIGDLILRDKQPSRIDKYFLAEHINMAREHRGELWDALSLVARWACEDDPDTWALKLKRPNILHKHDPSKFAEKTLEFLECLVDETRLATEHADKFWLCEIVDSALDADRFDYLMRDTYELRHVQQVDPKLVRQLIQKARVLPAILEIVRDIDGRVAGEKIMVQRIHWDVSMKTPIENILSIRSSLYMDVYESPSKRVFDEMVSHALVWILRDEIRSDASLRKPPDEVLSDTLRSVARITDDELFHFLYEIGTCSRHRLALSILHDVTTGRPFREIWRYSIERDRLTAAQRRMLSIADQWQKLESEMSANVARSRGELTSLHLYQELPFSRIFNGLQQGRSVESEEDWDGLIYLMEVLHGRSFRSREQLERIIWKHLIDGGGNAKLRDMISAALREIAVRLAWNCAGSDAVEKMIIILRETPLLMFSVPWVPRVDTAPESVDWDRQQAIVLHNGGQSITSQLDPAERHHQQLFPVALYLPAILAEKKEICDLACTLACKLVWSGAFYRAEGLMDDSRPKSADWESVEIGSILARTQIVLN